MNMERAKNWLAESDPGDRIMYLQADYAGRRPELAAVMMTAAEEGLVVLTQQRVSEGVYKYYAKRVDKKVGEIMRPGRWFIP